MNWRVELPYEAAVQAANNNDLKYMLQNDQLLNYGPKHPLTSQFSEGPLNFKPTFKYDDNCDAYDTSKKMRVPSWTDRVLYTKDNCKLLYYNRRESRFSDHRPVLAVFEIMVKRNDNQTMMKLQNEQISQIMQRNPMPSNTGVPPEFTKVGGGIKPLDHDYLSKIMVQETPKQPAIV